MLGRVVATLVDNELEAGLHEARWEARAASGIYLARLTASAPHHPEADAVRVRKMVLMH